MPRQVRCLFLHFFPASHPLLVAYREARYLLLINASWGKNPADSTPAMREKVISWARKLYNSLASLPGSLGAYASEEYDSKEAALQSVFGQNLARLRNVKKKYGEFCCFAFFCWHDLDNESTIRSQKLVQYQSKYRTG